MKSKKYIYKLLFLFFLTSLLFKPLWIINNQDLGMPADDLYHWLHASTLALDLDIDYVKDYQITGATVNKKTNVPSAHPGAGYLASPFVFLFSIIDKFQGNEVQRINPTKSFSYIGFFASGLFYIITSFLLITKIIEKNNYRLGKVFFYLALLSSILHFTFTRFLMPHSAEFFLCTLIIYILEVGDLKKRSFYTSLYFIYFLLLITRPSTFIYYSLLLLVFKNKFYFSKQFFLNSIITLSTLIFAYVKLSNILFDSNYILYNIYQSDGEEYIQTFNMSQLLSGVLKLPNLFFSPSMGIFWVSPIIFYAFLILIKKFSFRNITLEFINNLLFFFTSFIPLFIWQGREIAYGQRLLIGLIPYCIVFISKNYKHIEKFTKVAYLNCFITYIGYLFFYSSEKLTLRKGISLWGTELNYSAQNYYLELVYSFSDLETILSAFSRNIYFVDIFKFFNFEKISLFLNIENLLTLERFNKFNAYANIYQQIDILYLIIVNILIFLFSFLFSRILLAK